MPAVTYNNVQMPFCLTTSFNQTAESDPSDTDWYAVKLDMTVQSIFTADVLPLMFPDLANQTDNAADIMMVVRSRLLERRKALSVTCDGVELIPTTAPGGVGTVDTQNGPIPKYCNVTQLNDASFLVTWRVEATYWENNDEGANFAGNPKVLNQPGNPVLYNRWSETQEMDQCLFTRKTREGKFVIRSDNNQGGIVDTFRRQMAVLGVPRGFLRESSYYKVDPSGLGLEYRFVDVQQYKMPPVPAYKATGSYTEEILRNGGQRWGTVHIRLEGRASGGDAGGAFNQSAMMLAALGIASAKLRANGVQGALGLAPGAAVPPGAQNQKFSVLEYAQTQVGMYENYVEVRMRARMKQSRTLLEAGQEKAKIWQFNPNAFTFTPGSNGVDRVMRYPIRGTAGTPDNRLLLQAAAYYDPSLRNTAVDPFQGQLNAAGQLEVGQAGINLES